MTNKRHRDKIRNQAISILGDSCVYCNTKERLEFHHLYYVNNENPHGVHSYSRHKETIKHPERFELVCHTCHQIITILNSDRDSWNKIGKVLQKYGGGL